jgi:hypothetical protein
VRPQVAILLTYVDEHTWTVYAVLTSSCMRIAAERVDATHQPRLSQQGCENGWAGTLL